LGISGFATTGLVIGLDATGVSVTDLETTGLGFTTTGFGFATTGFGFATTGLGRMNSALATGLGLLNLERVIFGINFCSLPAVTELSFFPLLPCTIGCTRGLRGLNELFVLERSFNSGFGDIDLSVLLV
jgi:hypothetical protein